MAIGRVISPGLYVNNFGLSAHLTRENRFGFVVTFSSFFVFRKFHVRSKLHCAAKWQIKLKRPNKLSQAQTFQNVMGLP
jgi:hypothetical protein